MKPRIFTAFALVVSLALLLAMSTAAQGPHPGGGELDTHSRGRVNPDRLSSFLRDSSPSGNLGPQSVNAPVVDVGQPGLSFRYVRTFGETDVPYMDDPNHLNDPWGLGTDGNSVWIAENDGRRALKFANDGAFITQIGVAGFRVSPGTSIVGLYDVAVDQGGNTWLVDGQGQHVIKFSPTGTRISELGLAWNSGTGNDRFNQPYSIAFDGTGNIYISDSNNHRIQVFSPSGAYAATIGVTGTPGADNSHFNQPTHIAIDGSNRLYVADGGNHRVQIFDVSGFPAVGYVATLGQPGVAGSDNAHFDFPEGVALDPAHNRIYVADGNNFRVQVFNYTTRAYQQTLSLPSYISDVAVDVAGNLYATQRWFDQSQVRQYNANLMHVRNYGTLGVPYLTDDYHYNQPSAVAVAPDGSIYIGEAGGRRLIKLNDAGAAQWIIGQASNWGGDNQSFSYIDDVALDSADRVYATDRNKCRVQIYNPDGSYYATLGSGCGSGNNQFQMPYGVAIGPGDIIYVADTANNRVQVFSANRVYMATLGETGVPASDNAHLSWPKDVATDAAGNIYIADENNQRVQVFRSNRTYWRTIGVTGITDGSFGYVPSPRSVAVDAAGRTYVSDLWATRVQVFDTSGAYLTSIGSIFGNGSSQVRDAEGLAVDREGNLYVADAEAHRVQKFTAGVLGWVQTNINGFGDRTNPQIVSLAPFTGSLYASTFNWSGNGAQLWRTTDGVSWTSVTTNVTVAQSGRTSS